MSARESAACGVLTGEQRCLAGVAAALIGLTTFLAREARGLPRHRVKEIESVDTRQRGRVTFSDR